MSATLTQTEFDQLSQQVSRRERYARNVTLLSKAKSAGDMAGQLTALRHMADTKYGLTGRAQYLDAARECTAVARQLAYRDDGSRFGDPAAEAAKAKNFAKSLTARAAQFQELRGEVMQAIAKARSEGDSDSLMQLYGIRDHLTTQARSARGSGWIPVCGSCLRGGDN